MIGTNDCFKRGNCLIANITVRHRHLGINLIFTTQNPRSINSIVRNNIDIFAIYKFSNIKMISQKVYDEVSNILREQEFEEAYRHATKEPHDFLVIDTHPDSAIDKPLKEISTLFWLLNNSINFACFLEFLCIEISYFLLVQPHSHFVFNLRLSIILFYLYYLLYILEHIVFDTLLFYHYLLLRTVYEVHLYYIIYSHVSCLYLPFFHLEFQTL